MTFIEALYGAQYEEIQQRNGNGHKSRLAGNLLLSAMILLGIFTLFVVLTSLFLESGKSINAYFHWATPKTMAKVLTLPAWALIYWITSRTIGSIENYRAAVDRFMAYPAEVRKKGNITALTPLGLVFLCFLLAVVFAK